MAKVGVSKLHYAVMNTEDTATTAAVYGNPVAIPGLASVDVQAASETATLYADNGPYETATGMGEVTVSLDLADLEPEAQAALLGHTLNEDGTLDKKSTDVAPYVALMFEFLMANNKKRCVKLYKGKFSVPNDTGETKGATPNLQTQSISASFVQCKNDNRWESTKDFEPTADTASWYASVLPN